MGKYFIKEAANLIGKLFTQGVDVAEIASRTGRSVAEVKAIGADVIKGQQTGQTFGRNAKAYGEGKTNLDTFLGNVEPAAKINPRLGTGGSPRVSKLKQVTIDPILVRPGIASVPNGNPAPTALTIQEKAQIEAHKSDKAKQVLESIKAKKDPVPFDTSSPVVNDKVVMPGPVNPFMAGGSKTPFPAGPTNPSLAASSSTAPKEPDVFDKARNTYTKYKAKAKANPWGYGAGAGAVAVGGALAFSGGKDE